MRDPFTQLPSSDYQNDSLRDLTAHNELMQQLQECLTAMNNLMLEAGKVNNAVADHNISDKSHEDIRRQLQSMGNISDASIDQKLQSHDTSITSHAALRTKVDNILQQVANITAAIDTSVATHNLASDSHTDIRAAINQLTAQVGDIDLASITTELREELANATAELQESITIINSSIESLGTNFDAYKESVTKLETKVDSTAEKLSSVVNNNSYSRTGVESAILRIEELRRLHDILDEQANDDDPYSFTHTLVSAILPGKTVSFSMHASLRDGRTNATFEIMKLDNGANCTCTFSKETGIGQDEVVNLTADPDNTEGKIYSFGVKIIDTTTNAYIIRVISISIARPFESGNIYINNFPSASEPDRTYNFSIMNLDETNDGRYTYQMSSTSQYATFNPAEASTSQSFTMTVAPDTPRGIDIPITLTVHDKILDTDTIINSVLHINDLPDSSKFDHTFPDKVKPNYTFNFRMFGLTASDGSSPTYTILEKPTWMTISPMSNILTNSAVKVIVDGTAVRGRTTTIKVKSTDINDVSFEYTLTTKVNQLPSAASITTTIPATIYGGNTLSFRISGGVDADEDSTSLKYNIDSNSTGLSFNKISNISPTDEIRVNIPKVNAQTVKTIRISCVDSLGETSSDDKQVDIVILPVWVADVPRITAPNNFAEVPYSGFTMTWTPFSYHADV